MVNKPKVFVAASLFASLILTIGIAVVVLQYFQGQNSDLASSGRGGASQSNGEQPSNNGSNAEKSTPPPKSSSPTITPTASASPSLAAQRLGGSTPATGGGASSGSGSTPPPASPSSCPNASHTPGGSDGLGGCWPYSGNTGVPSGKSLSTYTGPCTITSGNSGAAVTIDSKDATACGILAVYDVAVTIKNSRMPVIDRTNMSGSVNISDSDFDGSGWVGGVLWGSNITATRVEVVGGQHSVHCESNCTVTDSWLHGQEAPGGSATHNNAFISNGGSNMTVRHNSLYCSPADNGAGGGCTADASVFGDFDNLNNITFDKNLFLSTPSGGYCGTFGYNPGKPYGNSPSNIAVTNNVFQKGTNGKCGVYGPVTSFLSANGNTWSGNKYTDGTVINP